MCVRSRSIDEGNFSGIDVRGDKTKSINMYFVYLSITIKQKKIVVQLFDGQKKLKYKKKINKFD